MRAFGTMRGSLVNTPVTSVKISHTSALSAAASATAVVSDAPRPSVVISPSSVTPWKPGSTGIPPRASSSRMRDVSMRRMRARAWSSSVYTLTWALVKLRECAPSPWIAIAVNAIVCCSPVDTSMSYSRGSGLADISFANATS